MTKMRFKFKRLQKIFLYNHCIMHLTKDRPGMNYWYCRVRCNCSYVNKGGDITRDFANIAPYFKYMGVLAIYHNMALTLLRNEVREIDDRENYFWGDKREKSNKKRRLKNENIRNSRIKYL